MKTKNWEKELRKMIEIACSDDDCDEIECGIRYVRSLLKQARQEGIEEVLKEVEEDIVKFWELIDKENKRKEVFENSYITFAPPTAMELEKFLRIEMDWFKTKGKLSELKKK